MRNAAIEAAGRLQAVHQRGEIVATAGCRLGDPQHPPTPAQFPRRVSSRARRRHAAAERIRQGRAGACADTTRGRSPGRRVPRTPRRSAPINLPGKPNCRRAHRGDAAPRRRAPFSRAAAPARTHTTHLRGNTGTAVRKPAGPAPPDRLHSAASRCRPERARAGWAARRWPGSRAARAPSDGCRDRGRPTAHRRETRLVHPSIRAGVPLPARRAPYWRASEHRADP